MDYLLSLVGKDEDTILDAMKEMVENGEKLKNQEKEIEGYKEEVHYLKNKLDQKYDVVDDLENELEPH